ncbi:MAG: hypothetical protein K2P16_05605, partial [Lawsonibacter sp.]|nr:hypothetical protein [Lawsonibacter sp.]
MFQFHRHASRDQFCAPILSDRGEEGKHFLILCYIPQLILIHCKELPADSEAEGGIAVEDRKIYEDIALRT